MANKKGHPLNDIRFMIRRIDEVFFKRIWRCHVIGEVLCWTLTRLSWSCFQCTYRGSKHPRPNLTSGRGLQINSIKSPTNISEGWIKRGLRWSWSSACNEPLSIYSEAPAKHPTRYLFFSNMPRTTVVPECPSAGIYRSSTKRTLFTKNPTDKHASRRQIFTSLS